MFVQNVGIHLQDTRRHSPEDHSRHLHRFENLKYVSNFALSFHILRIVSVGDRCYSIRWSVSSYNVVVVFEINSTGTECFK